MYPPKGMENNAAMMVAVSDIYNESAAICRTSGFRVVIRLIA
jgi:hypothetical protein